jgi:hypothetical protein
MVFCSIPECVVHNFWMYSHNEALCCHRDVILYALGIGAAAPDQSDSSDLAFVYEGENGKSLKVS